MGGYKPFEELFERLERVWRYVENSYSYQRSLELGRDVMILYDKQRVLTLLRDAMNLVSWYDEEDEE